MTKINKLLEATMAVLQATPERQLKIVVLNKALSAGGEALQERERIEQEWLAHARKEAEDGFAALDRGEGVPGTAAEHMARIDAAVRARRVGP